MYAAIEEASVGEGSDTYAQIPDPRTRRTNTQAPVQQPPSDNTHTHEVTVHARYLMVHLCIAVTLLLQ